MRALANIGSVLEILAELRARHPRDERLGSAVQFSVAVLAGAQNGWASASGDPVADLYAALHAFGRASRPRPLEVVFSRSASVRDDVEDVVVPLLSHLAHRCHGKPGGASEATEFVIAALRLGYTSGPAFDVELATLYELLHAVISAAETSNERRSVGGP